jgi:hypothetical protein
MQNGCAHAERWDKVSLPVILLHTCTTIRSLLVAPNLEQLRFSLVQNSTYVPLVFLVMSLQIQCVLNRIFHLLPQSWSSSNIIFMQGTAQTPPPWGLCIFTSPSAPAPASNQVLLVLSTAHFSSLPTSFHPANYDNFFWCLPVAFFL